MKNILGVILVFAAVGCRKAEPPGGASVADELAKSPLRLSLEYPNAPDGEVRDRGPLTLHVHNQSKEDIRLLTDYAQALTLNELKLGVRDADGKAVPSVRAFSTEPPEAPKESDYVRLKPGESCRLSIRTGDVANAYGLKPNTLYFIEVSLQPKGQKEPCVLRSPFGFAKFQPK